jgi:phosphoribosylformylglycinamidine synthase
MKFGVVIFPGSNCDQDLIEVISAVTRCEVVELWHKTTDLQGCDFIFLPGGFSYGDYLRSGAIAKLSPIMESVIAFANNGGYVMGICNGFQILCESGLLPGALLRNNSQKFLCKNVTLSVATESSLLTQKTTKNEVLTIPIAHAEGRFYADEEQIKSMEENDQVLFRYCDEKGNVTEDSNPNGSINNIAGVCNTGRNVFGMMPHPERCASDELFNEDGKALFEGLMQELSLS